MHLSSANYFPLSYNLQLVTYTCPLQKPPMVQWCSNSDEWWYVPLLPTIINENQRKSAKVLNESTYWVTFSIRWTYPWPMNSLWWVPNECSVSRWWVYSHCTLIAHSLHTHCTLIAQWLYTQLLFDSLCNV